MLCLFTHDEVIILSTKMLLTYDTVMCGRVSDEYKLRLIVPPHGNNMGSRTD